MINRTPSEALYSTTQHQYVEASPPLGDDPAPVEIYGMDCLRLAHSIYSTTGRIPCVLNMANQFYVAGDYLSCQGQEESIVRRTNLLDSLMTLNGVVKGNICNPWLYQLEDCLGISNERQRSGFGEFTCLYSPGIIVWTLDDDLTMHEEKLGDTEMFKINVLSSAAYNLAENDLPDRPLYIGGTVFKILNQLRVAKLHGERILILGPLGCGAFHNDSGIIAHIYRSALNEYEFQGCFDEVHFAIKAPVESSKNRIYENFTREFNSKFPPQLIRDILVSEISKENSDKNARLAEMMAPFERINSVEELFFLAKRRIKYDLCQLQGNSGMQKKKRKFLTDLLEELCADPLNTDGIIFRKMDSAEFHALTPPAHSIFSNTPFLTGLKLCELAEQFRHGKTYTPCCES